MMKFRKLGRAFIALPAITLAIIDKQLEESNQKKNYNNHLGSKPILDEMLYDIFKRKCLVMKIEEPQTIADIMPISGKSFIVKDNMGLSRYKIDKANLTSEVDLEALKELLNNAIYQHLRDNKIYNMKQIKIYSVKPFKSYIEVIICYQVA